jgi:hypothetical protein
MNMTSGALSLMLALLASQGTAFSVVQPTATKAAATSTLFASADNNESNHASMDRRSLFQATASATLAAVTFAMPLPNNIANAAEPKKVVVAGATGQTGRRKLPDDTAHTALDSHRLDLIHALS